MKFTREFFIEQGRIGGKKRAETLSPERRSAIARKAGKAKKKPRVKA